LEKGVEFMATYKANIERKEDDSVSLKLILGLDEFSIVLTDDSPNNIKSVFNQLLVKLKDGEIEFELVDEKEDLYTHVCKEYLTQLNAELASTYSELKDNNLLNTK
jgi:hypothetical protein